MVGCCVHGDLLLGLVRSGELFYQLSDYKLVKKLMKFVSIKHCCYDNENVKILTEGCYIHWCFSVVGALFLAKFIKL